MPVVEGWPNGHVLPFDLRGHLVSVMLNFVSVMLNFVSVMLNFCPYHRAHQRSVSTVRHVTNDSARRCAFENAVMLYWRHWLPPSGLLLSLQSV